MGRSISVAEFGADTIAADHGQPAVMWTEASRAAFIAAGRRACRLEA